MTIVIAIGDKEANVSKFSYEHQGSKRIEVEQNGVHALKLPTNPCMCKGLGFMEPSNTHNYRSYNIIFRKISVTHTKLNVLIDEIYSFFVHFISMMGYVGRWRPANNVSQFGYGWPIVSRLSFLLFWPPKLSRVVDSLFVNHFLQCKLHWMRPKESFNFFLGTISE